MHLSSIALALTTISATLAPIMANMPDSAVGSFKVEALCTISNAYATCHPQINDDRLIINFPSKLVVLDKDEVKSIGLYDSRHREFIRFFTKTDDINFAISFLEGNGTRTGIIRFKNNISARKFYKRLVEYNPALFKSPVYIEIY